MDSTGYSAKGAESLLAEYGYFYVPQNCRDDASLCDLHVHYHGCIDFEWAKREMWTDNIELNEYAESNDIIVFYPQNIGNNRVGEGCWNWSEYKIDEYFDTQKGQQLNTAYRIT
jgi:poly(3-hydroxybutyrate) depolymerase